MLTVGVVVLGVQDVERAAAFWSEALGYRVHREGFGGWATVVVPAEGHDGAKIALQRSVTPLQDRPRIHLDLHVPDASEQAAEVERLVGLGAKRIDWHDYPEDPDFVVLADTEGNVFCIVDLTHGLTHGTG